MLTRREHSQLELVRKLAGKGFFKEDIENLLEEFIRLNWQSDQRFAENYSRFRVHKGFGPVRIQYELKERGIDAQLNTVFKGQPNWDELLSQLHTKKYGSEPPEDMKERAKRTRFFQHKGYTHDMIRQLFNDMS